ncbi:MAG: hypothetical protein JXL67_05375, partial [Calditrichaeota bacterium]|nr:hypothetical protein [Calditrichota bacterium]
IQRDPVTRLFSFDVNTAMAVPNGPASGFQNPTLADNSDNLVTRESGNATGKVWIEFLNPFEVEEGKEYDVLFEEVQIDSNTTATGFSVIDLEPVTVTFSPRDTAYVSLLSGQHIREGTETIRNSAGSEIDTSLYKMDYFNARIRATSLGDLNNSETYTATFLIEPVASSTSINGEDDNSVFDGMRIFVQNEETALSPLSINGGKSGFKVIETNTNFSDDYTTISLAQVGTFAPYPSDFEFRFTDYDTTQDGSLISPADSAIKLNPNLPGIKTPFKIIDTETGERVNFFISEVSGLRNYRWDWQETIVMIKPGAQLPTETTYQVKFSPPVDTLTSATGEDSVVVRDPIYPGVGDVFLLFSEKPFDPGDEYVFETKAAIFDDRQAKNALDEIYVVPNPYIAYSSSEIAGPRTGDRDDRRLEFRNLPRQCTIRIYTIAGELVDTIVKNDVLNYALWDMLTFESQELAYGVYFYHIDAPGVGTKIGRFAVIK